MDERYGNYIWDDDNNQVSVEVHGLSFQRAIIALEEGNPVQVNERCTDKGEVRYEDLAHLNGETIKVVYARNGDDIKIISAHKNNRGNFDHQYEEGCKKTGNTKNTLMNQDFDAWRKCDKTQQELSEDDIKPLRESHKKIENLALKECSPEERATITEQLRQKHRQERQSLLEEYKDQRVALYQSLQKARAFDDQAKTHKENDEHRNTHLRERLDKFKTKHAELQRQIGAAPDIKTRERLDLQGRIEEAKFNQSYKRACAEAIYQQDPVKHRYDRLRLLHDAKQADIAFQDLENTWNANAVRDDNYKPRDEKASSKVNEVRELEQKAWADLEERGIKAGWDAERLAKEKEKLQYRLDQYLNQVFELSQENSHTMDM